MPNTQIVYSPEETATQVAELKAAIAYLRGLIVAGATVGFNPLEGEWATQLFESQGMTYDLLYKNN